MNDADFAKESASLCARCTPEQRRQLAELAQSYDTKAEDRKRSGRTADEQPASFNQMFPNASRLAG